MRPSLRVVPRDGSEPDAPRAPGPARLADAIRETLALPSLRGADRKAKRAADVVLAAGALAVAAPIAVPLAALALAAGGRIRATPIVGLGGRTTRRLVAAMPRNPALRALSRTGLALLPLLDVARGRLSLVGPRPLSPAEAINRGDRAHDPRWTVRPGLLDPEWVRQRSNVDYGDEPPADVAYAAEAGLSTDAAMALKALVLLPWDEDAPVPVRPEVLGVPFLNVTMDDALDALADALAGDHPRQGCFINADCLNLAARNEAYREVLRTADFVFADGVGVRLAGRINGWRVRQNVNGTDLFPRLCRVLEARGTKVFLLGGRPGVADDAARWVARHHPGIDVCGTWHGYFRPEDEDDVVRRIRESGAQLLLVALGAPAQDLWIRRRLADCGARLGLGVGGLFDFYSGRIPRAPLWVREAGLEWLFRFAMEPRRMWRRYLVGNAVFVGRVLGRRTRGGG